MQPNMYPPQYPGQPAGYPGVPTQFGQQTPAQFPGYPPQGFPQQPPQAPAQPLVQGTLDDFYNQPSTGGGKALSFDQKPYGTTYIGVVSRPMGNGDVQQQTNKQGIGQVFRDNRPKLVMLVPLQLEISPEFPDGRATWYVKGGTRDELARAMAEAGAPEGAPEAGAIIRIVYTGERASGAGYNPTKLFAVTYGRPDGAGPVAPPAPVAQPQYAPLPPVPAIPGPGADALAAQQAAYLAQQQAAAQALAPQPTLTGQANVMPAPPAATVTPEPSEAQKILLGRLTGQTG